MRIGLALFRGVVAVLLLLLAVSYFWNSWIDRLPAPWPGVVYGLLLVAIVLDLATSSSDRLARLIFGKRDQ